MCIRDRPEFVPMEILPERSKSMSPESQCFLVLVKIRWESVFVHKVYPRKGWKSKQNCLRDMSSQENYILCEFCYHRKKTIILPYKRAMVSSVSRTLWSNSAEMTLFRSIFIIMVYPNWECPQHHFGKENESWSDWWCAEETKSWLCDTARSRRRNEACRGSCTTRQHHGQLDWSHENLVAKDPAKSQLNAKNNQGDGNFWVIYLLWLFMNFVWF